MICSYCNPSMIKGGLPESSFMTLSFLQEFRTVKGKGNRKQPSSAASLLVCFPTPTTLEPSGRKGDVPVPGPPLPQPS